MNHIVQNLFKFHRFLFWIQFDIHTVPLQNCVIALFWMVYLYKKVEYILNLCKFNTKRKLINCSTNVGTHHENALFLVSLTIRSHFVHTVWRELFSKNHFVSTFCWVILGLFLFSTILYYQTSSTGSYSL